MGLSRPRKNRIKTVFDKEEELDDDEAPGGFRDCFVQHKHKKITHARNMRDTDSFRISVSHSFSQNFVTNCPKYQLEFLISSRFE